MFTKEKDKYPAQPSMVGNKIYLRPAAVKDIISTYHWFNLTEPQYLSCRPLPFRTSDEAGEAYKNKEQTPDARKFMVIRQKDNTSVGIVSFFNSNSLNRSTELGVLIDPDERKKGFAGEALKTLCYFLFLYRDFNKVHAQTAEFNKGAIKLLEKLGFHKDATLRQNHFYKGQLHDSYIYSLLHHERNWEPFGIDPKI